MRAIADALAGQLRLGVTHVTLGAGEGEAESRPKTSRRPGKRPDNHPSVGSQALGCYALYRLIKDVTIMRATKACFDMVIGERTRDTCLVTRFAVMRFLGCTNIAGALTCSACLQAGCFGANSGATEILELSARLTSCRAPTPERLRSLSRLR